ncbi:hypothetical protein GH714_019106 [Hevea brasiliensis]|uniref:Uncharacterized protein n=1 Tax=Hevea brasiliensis TaxID=3981 RepID=A0A6A6MFL3_HEVBR|nr:hypothetical protein GH714_019106 [Hevea brasiliensis]
MQATQAATYGVAEVSSQAVLKHGEPSNEEASNPEPGGRRLDLSVQIPPKPIGFGTSRSGNGLIHSKNSCKGSSSSGGLLRGLSFKKKGVVPDGERSFLLKSDPTTAPDSPVMASLRSAWKRCMSLPVTPTSNLSPSVSTPISARMPGDSHKTRKGPAQGVVSRSLSVPGQNIVIVRSSSFASHNENDQTTTSNDQISAVPVEVDDEEILKRKLYVGSVLMYVKKEIHQNGVQLQSAWQDFVVLVLISTICYFFFLEQLLIRDMKTQAVIIAVPFAFTLGLLASIFAVILAIREYIWTYAALEFALIAVFVHLFYSLLHLKAIYAILVSSVLGFGIAVTLNSLYSQYYVSRVQAAQNPSPV